MFLKLFIHKSAKTVLAEKEQEAKLVHQKNIDNIVKSRQPAVELTKALRQNHIIIQIAGAVGGK